MFCHLKLHVTRHRTLWFVFRSLSDAFFCFPLNEAALVSDGPFGMRFFPSFDTCWMAIYIPWHIQPIGKSSHSNEYPTHGFPIWTQPPSGIHCQWICWKRLVRRILDNDVRVSFALLYRSYWVFMKFIWNVHRTSIPLLGLLLNGSEYTEVDSARDNVSPHSYSPSCVPTAGFVVS